MRLSGVGPRWACRCVPSAVFGGRGGFRDCVGGRSRGWELRDRVPSGCGYRVWAGLAARIGVVWIWGLLCVGLDRVNAGTGKRIDRYLRISAIA